MSWFAENYEKAALGVAGVLALGLTWFGFSKYGAVEQDFAISLVGSGKNETAVKSAELIQKASQSLKLPRTWQREEFDSRDVDLFTGVPLFISKSSKDKAIDLRKDDPVHAPIPNTWWTEHALDPGFANSPQLDPDADGFNNLEEFQGKTDPNNAKSYPALIAKLLYVKDESLAWVIRPGYGTGSGFPFKYEDSKGGSNATPAGESISENGMFFPKAPQMNRFKLLGSEIIKETNPRTKIETDVTMVIIEDQRANKKGTKYRFPSPLQDDARKQPYVQYDRTAVFSLEALGMGGKQFLIEENTTFGIPADSPKKDYLLKKVTPDSVTVEYPAPDGSRRTVDILKGGLPKISP